MTENEFRIQHSVLIEYYQLIERRLKGLIAAILCTPEKSWFVLLEDYDSDPMGKLLNKIRQIQEEQKFELLSAEQLEQLDTLRQSRNYWCHQCFATDKPVTFNRLGNVKRAEHAVRIKNDLREADEWDKMLTEIARQFPPAHIDF